MPEPTTPNHDPDANAAKRTPPAAIWFACGALAIISLVQLFEPRGRYATIAVMLRTVVLFGLFRGHKWAYVLMVIGTAAGIAAVFITNPSHGIAALLCNAVVLVPVLLSKSYFFPEQKPKVSSREPNSSNNQQQGNVV